jgi:hypothetical protein
LTQFLLSLCCNPVIAAAIGTSHLIARPNWTNDPDASIELGEFIEQALTAANDKARELGWIV